MQKPSLSIPQQIAQLAQRGLLDSNGQLPRALLTHGYFRLSGYWRYFQTDPAAGRNSFIHGTEFATVYDVYELDVNLRALLLEGMAELEVALRAALAANLCAAGGSGTEYLDPATYRDSYNDGGDSLRDILIRDITDDIERSKERHVKHHRSAGVGSVPFWVAAEAMSFGTLSRLFGLLDDETKRESIAKRFGYDDGLLSSMQPNLRAVSVFRNVCAHHSRVWNRVVHNDKPRLFQGALEAGENRNTYAEAPWGVIVVLGHYVKHIRRNDSFMQDVTALLSGSSDYARGLKQPSRM